MKNKFLRSSILIVLLGVLILQSCKKRIDAAYLNPNALVAPPVESILPGIIGGFTWFSSAQGTTYGVIVDGTFVGKFVQYFQRGSCHRGGVLYLSRTMVGAVASKCGVPAHALCRCLFSFQYASGGSHHCPHGKQEAAKDLD